MTRPLEPSRRGPGCPPAATLEAHAAGEAVPAAVAAHLTGCPACSAQLAALREAAEAFLRARPPALFLRQLERREEVARSRPAGLRRLVGALAVAVPVALAAVLVPRLLHPGDEAGVTFKGGGAFRVAVSRGGVDAPELAAADGVVRAGDALRFAYEAPADGYLLVLELDGRGEAAVLHPFGAAEGAPVAAGSRDFLPGSVVLDAAPGPEFLFAVFSPRPVEAGPLLASLRAQARRPDPALACAGCTVASLRLQKAP